MDSIGFHIDLGAARRAPERYARRAPPARPREKKGSENIGFMKFIRLHVHPCVFWDGVWVERGPSPLARARPNFPVRLSERARPRMRLRRARIRVKLIRVHIQWNNDILWALDGVGIRGLGRARARAPNSASGTVASRRARARPNLNLRAPNALHFRSN